MLLVMVGLLLHLIAGERLISYLELSEKFKNLMRQFCVFGNPIAHSKSPLLHNATFRFYDIDAFYGRVLLPLAFASDKVLESKSKDCLYASFLDLGLSGANITVPFKQSAFLQADEVRGIGQEIGAINTWVLENNAVIGYNTDAQGFFMCLQDWLAKISNALILGAGGSAKAVAFALRQNGITPTIYNRSSARLEEFLQNGFPHNSKIVKTPLI